jgi:hypothetical protein
VRALPPPPHSLPACPALPSPQVVHALRRGAYHFYCTQTPWVAPLMFRLATQQNAATRAVAGAEKSAFAWVPLAALLECVAVPGPRYFLETRAHVCGGPGTPPPAKCGRRCFQVGLQGKSGSLDCGRGCCP